MPISSKGTMIIKPGKIAYTILKWMQDKEDTSALKSTTAHIISEKICDLPDETHGVIAIEQTFSKMVRNNVIYRDKTPRGVYSDYRINYWHKNIPADILANAPVEVKRSMAKTIDDMKPGQYMDDEGCVVTPGAIVTEGDPFSEGDEFEETDISKHATAVAEMHAVTVENTAPQFEEEKTAQEVTVPVEVKKDGKTMSITVNLTINL